MTVGPCSLYASTALDLLIVPSGVPGNPPPESLYVTVEGRSPKVAYLVTPTVFLWFQRTIRKAEKSDRLTDSQRSELTSRWGELMSWACENLDGREVRRVAQDDSLPVTLPGSDPAGVDKETLLTVLMTVSGFADVERALATV